MRGSERRLVGALIALSFLQGVSNTLGAAVGKSLFLSRFGPEGLPWAYSAVSLVLPLLGVLFIAASRRLSPARLLTGTAALSGGVHAAIWLALHLGMDRAAAAVAMVWVEVDWSLVLLVFLGVSSHRLDVRQQRRLLGVAAGGDVVAGIGGGYILPLVLPALGLENVPLLAALAQFGSAVLVARLLLPLPPTREKPTPIRALVEDRFLRSAWALLALGWFAFYLIDALFLSVASARFGTQEDLAAFMGVFLGTAAVADAVASLGLYGFLLGRFGVLGGLLGGPVGTAICALMVLFALGAPGMVLLLAVTALKLADATARENITEPAVSTLYGALPPPDRAAAQAIGGAVVGPIAGLLAAPALWLVLGPLDLGLRGLTLLTLVVLLAVGALAVGLGRAWPRALRRALLRGGPEEADVTLGGAASHDTLVDGLMAPEPEMVLASARLLRGVARDALAERIPALLAHRDAEVRLGIARLLEDAPLSEAVAKLATRLVEEPEVNVRARLYRALMATDADTGRALLEARVRSAQLADRGAALDALLRHGSAQDEPLIEETLSDLQSGSEVERRVAEQLIAQTRPWTDSELQARLLQLDPWALAPMLKRRRIEPERLVRTVLGGWDASGPEERRRLTTALGVLAGGVCEPALLRALDEPAAAPDALLHLGAGALSERALLAVRARVELDLDAAAQLRSQADHAAPLLAQALRDDAREASRRCLLGLGLLRPGQRDLGALWRPLQVPEERALALEILESTLPRADWLRLEPLLPGAHRVRVSSRAATLLIHDEPGPLDPRCVSRWTLRCAHDPSGAAEDAEGLTALRRVRFLSELPTRVLVELARDEALRKWSERRGSLEDLPDGLASRLLLDHPDARRPLLQALVGAGEPAGAPQLGGVPVEMSPQEALLAVRACPQFSQAPAAVQRVLVGQASARLLEPGEILMRRGAPGGVAAVLVSGSSDRGGAGLLLGARSALSGSAWAQDVAALQRSTVLLIPGASLMHAASVSAAVALALRSWLRRPAGG